MFITLPDTVKQKIAFKYWHDLVIIKKVVSDREKMIGARLRAFREMLQIPRTTFSLSIGFGSERIAAYESGRARLPYAVFKAVADRYALYPPWLAEGHGSPQVKNSFDDAKFIDDITPGALFSDVFKSHLAAKLKASADQVCGNANMAIEKLNELCRILDDKTIPDDFRHKIQVQIEPALNKMMRASSHHLKLRAKADNQLANVLNSKEWEKFRLTNRPTSSNIAGVKTLWSSLKQRLQSATEATGKKSELAKALNVDLTIVSRWLSNKKSAREPGAEYTLQMLHWVEQKERQ